jgi:transposase
VEVNVLDSIEQQSVLTLVRAGLTFREIERKLGIRRETVSKYAKAAGLVDPKPATMVGVPTGSSVQNRPPSEGCPPDGGAASPPAVPGITTSHCTPYHDWIQEQIDVGRNATAIYQDLVDKFGFQARYDSVKRFVGKLKRVDPLRFDRLEYLPGEEAQVDYGQGAPTLYEKTGRLRRPRLFVMTLKYSRKSFRKVVWNSSQETWARLHEEAFRHFGGCPQYIVLDNLKEGVLEPDIYEPRLNPIYAALLAHYGVVADPARPGDPDRKGTVESAIQHTQATALKGREFSSVDEQNEFLSSWEERWASQRIHGRTKRQVQAMFEEEKPHLLSLPLANFRFFRQEERTVQDDGMIEVQRSYYFASPSLIGARVPVRIFELELEILNPKDLSLLRRHSIKSRPGSISMEEGERIYNPSRQTERLLRQAAAIGPYTRALCEALFREEGRPGQRRIQGIISLARKFPAEKIEAACARAAEGGVRRYRTIKRILEAAPNAEPVPPQLAQEHALIRSASDYQAFWDSHAQMNLGLQEQPDQPGAQRPLTRSTVNANELN